MNYDCDYCVHCIINDDTEEEFCDIGKEPPLHITCIGLEHYKYTHKNIALGGLCKTHNDMNVEAKFEVVELTKFGNGGGKVVLNPVTGGSNENREFWKYTPAGKLELVIDNPEAFKQFEEMGEFYVTLKKA